MPRICGQRIAHRERSSGRISSQPITTTTTRGCFSCARVTTEVFAPTVLCTYEQHEATCLEEVVVGSSHLLPSYPHLPH